MTKAHEPITPGEILLTEFLEPLGISQSRLAQATALPQTRISEIVRGQRAITTETAPRLSKALGEPDHWRASNPKGPARSPRRRSRPR